MLGPLHAEQQLAAIEAASVPHMRQESVAKVMRRYERLVERGQRTHTAPTMHEALMKAGVEVELVPPRKGKNG